MHSVHRLNDANTVCVQPQSDPRRDALVVAGGFAAHPRADDTNTER